MDTAALPIPANVEALVDQNAVDPGIWRRITTESLAMGKRAQIRLLHHIVGVFASHEPCGNVAQLAVRLGVRLSDGVHMHLTQ
jgi:hypothetical protein